MKLEVRDVNCAYGSKIVLDGVEFSIRDGEIATLLGPNGCGKSTLLKTIGRILRPRSGAVLLDGRSVFERPTAELAREMAVLPQTRTGSDELTVEELVSFGRYPHRRGFLSSKDRDVVEAVLGATRLRSFRRRTLGTLSGGERQRAWIAMTLAQEPKLLLLDEPTTFLDVRGQFEVIELIRQWNRQSGLTVVMVLHDLNLAASCSRTLIMLKDRKVRFAGTPAEVLTVDNIREIFGVETEILTGKNNITYCVATASSKGGER